MPTSPYYYNDGSRMDVRGCTKGGSALGMGASGPFFAFFRLLQPPQQLIRPEPFPGQHFPHHPVDLGPGDPGHLSSPPILLQTQEKGSSQQAQGYVVVPASPEPAPYQVRGRLSYSSSPTSLFSASNSVSIRHLEPPT